MWITTYFTENGTPKTGLTPTVDVWKVSDSSQVITAQAMSEVGGGFYKYFFAGYSAQEEYNVRCDGGVGLINQERYTYAGNEGFHDDIYEIQQTVTSIETLTRRVLGLSQENYRLFDTSYDVSGQRLTGCTIKLYGSKADADADTNYTARYTMTAVYGMSGQLSDYKVVKEAT
jgi:hypothetical protein